MKNALLLIVTALCSLIYAHGDHSNETVVSRNSLLWLKERLDLEGETYVKLQDEIRRYLSLEMPVKDTAHLRDSLWREMQKPSPSQKAVDRWTGDTAAGDTAARAAFARHLQSLRTILGHKTFINYLDMSDPVYRPETEEHGHIHSHEDGTTHTHSHDHAGEHDHTHYTHDHDHTHEDGVNHSHEHNHAGARSHSHEAQGAYHTHEAVKDTHEHDTAEEGSTEGHRHDHTPHEDADEPTHH
ncbi:MAG: hypothetical protein ACQEQV_11245 [Fibrobacterota bacterium]